MKLIQISVVIITFNEERNIARCLDSVAEIADEIVVVDSFSKDRTKEVCSNYPSVRFLENPFKGHIEQKNFALDQAKFDIVLSLDADEALSENLKKSIWEVKRNMQFDAYEFNRLSNYCGDWIRHGSWYPDVKLRLFNRHKVRWQGINPHDKAELIVPGKVKHLKGDLLHYTYYTVDEHTRKLDYFSTLAAEAYFKKGKKAGIFQLLVNPSFAFFRDYILRRGFLDGYSGWLIARLTAFYTLQKYAKLRFLYAQVKHQEA
jgi:glycosyltransferase involved in cell wall biosynthesis